MKKIKAEIVADSINPQGDRITTYLLTFPRFVLAELNTHRVFSKNSASSRAIPFKKMIEMVETDPFIPIAWQKEHKGMQGSEYITDEKLINRCKEVWLHAKDNAVERACELHGDNWIEPENKHLLLDVTKQLCNRLLEPFMWHTVLLTGTEFENFFELRCPQYVIDNIPTIDKNGNKTGKELSILAKSKREVLKTINELHVNNPSVYSGRWNRLNQMSDLDWLQINKSQAEIHMQALAESMWDAMNESTPKKLNSGEWHIPFGDKIDYALDKWNFLPNTIELWGKDMSEYGIKISTARCARLSYMTFDGEIDYKKDIKLHDTLLESQHMSPFEHCAKAMTNEEYDEFYKGRLVNKEFTFAKGYAVNYLIDSGNEEDSGWCNNFKGFIQYRYLIEN